MSKIKIVLAGNYRQYTDWLYENVLPDVEALKKYRYASHPDKIRGLVADEVVVVGTFWKDVQDAGEMYDLANSRIRR